MFIMGGGGLEGAVSGFGTLKDCTAPTPFEGEGEVSDAKMASTVGEGGDFASFSKRLKSATFTRLM